AEARWAVEEVRMRKKAKALVAPGVRLRPIPSSKSFLFVIPLTPRLHRVRYPAVAPRGSRSDLAPSKISCFKTRRTAAQEYGPSPTTRGKSMGSHPRQEQLPRKQQHFSCLLEYRSAGRIEPCFAAEGSPRSVPLRSSTSISRSSAPAYCNLHFPQLHSRCCYPGIDKGLCLILGRKRVSKFDDQYSERGF